MQLDIKDVYADVNENLKAQLQYMIVNLDLDFRT